jgi:RNA polymerase sigma factor (sigma-70 family)
MNNVTELIEDHLTLAELIALEYSNIPGSSIDDAFSEASVGLIAAAQAFDPVKGDFHTFANRVIRNRLNSFYAKQLRLARLFPKSLDDSVNWIASPSDLSGNSDSRLPLDAKQDVIRQVRKAETDSVLAAVMRVLSPRERILIECLRSGQSFSEIGGKLRISKQAACKSTKGALKKLRLGLERLGYRRVASDGQLGSTERQK